MKALQRQEGDSLSRPACRVVCSREQSALGQEQRRRQELEVIVQWPVRSRILAWSLARTRLRSAQKMQIALA